MRKRFTAPAELARQAEEYARLDHRTFSELVCEALRQHMRRYPKKALDASAGDLASRVAALERIVRRKYPQVPLGEVPGQAERS